MDDFKRQIKGYRRSGRTCPCCRETGVKHSRTIARRRLKRITRQEIEEGSQDSRGDE